VRIIDYKTSSVDDSPTSYYVGKKMQLQLYMSAVIGERIPAGVFYFPASVSYSDSEEGKFRMAGFFNSDEEAIRRGDKSISEEKKSEFFDAQLGKKGVEKSMDGETFGYFLDYATLLSEKAREEVKSGYIEPTPYGSVCSYCQFGGACGFCRGEKSEPRSEKAIKADEIAKIVKRKKEEENDG
jgi:ATP-dependent helicase/DNAse subunit B